MVLPWRNVTYAHVTNPTGDSVSCALVLASPRAIAQGRTAFDAARNKMVDEEIVAAGVKNPRVIEAMRDTPRHEFIPLGQRRIRLLRHGAAHRRRPDHLAAVRRGLHDRGHRSAAGRQGAGDRHRQRLSGGRALQAGPRRLHDRDRPRAGPQGRKDARTAALRQRPREDRRRLPGLARTCRRSTRSSSPARPKTCPRPWSSNSRKAAGW